jgi:hypothetical protein
MAWIIFEKACPKCHSHRIRRVERKVWMRYLPSTKYYKCMQCKTGLLVFYDKTTFKWG